MDMEESIARIINSVEAEQALLRAAPIRADQTECVRIYLLTLSSALAVQVSMLY